MIDTNVVCDINMGIINIATVIGHSSEIIIPAKHKYKDPETITLSYFDDFFEKADAHPSSITLDDLKALDAKMAEFRSDFGITKSEDLEKDPLSDMQSCVDYLISLF